MKKIFIVLIVIALTVAVFYSCARQVTENTGNDFSEMDNTDGGNNNSNGNNIGSSSAIYNFLDLVITEINWGGSYSNTTDATPNGEFVEIMNNTSSPINLTGFQLRYDGGGDFTNKRVTLPSIVLNPGEFLVVFITNSSNNPYELVLNTNTYKTFLWSGINYIGNGGFRIAIIAPNGEEIDFVETRSGKPGQVMMKGSSGMPKRTMERVLPFISGTNNSAWEAAVSNINYAYGGTNNLGTPGASNSVWFVFRAILLATPTNNTTINKALNSTQNFVWMLTGLGSSYSSYILVFTTSNQVFTNISVNTTNTNINILAFPVETYKWFVLGVSGGITNSSTGTNTLIITNFGNITLTSPPDNDIHNIAIDGNKVSFSWSYSPLGSLHVANVYLLDSNDNPVMSNINVSSTSSSINISTLPYGDYKWYVIASNTNSALVVYSTTNNTKITNYASVGLTSPSDNYTNNIAEDGTTISFSWVYSPTAAFNQANVYVLDSMNNVVASGTGLTTTSWNTSIPNVGVYNWYVLATNTSTGIYSYSSTNTIYVTNLGSISIVYPTNNHIHNILSDGNSISLSWSYTPTGAFNQATVYILNAVNNTIAMSTNVNTTNLSVDLSSLPSGRYRWFVMATNTIYSISSYTPTNNISVYRISNIYSGVFFSEIGWGGFRTTGSMSDGEFIEIYNTNSYDINLNGWTVSYINNSYSLGSVRHWSITNDIIIKSNSLVVFLNRTSNTNYIELDNIEAYNFMFESTSGAIANSGFVLWLWNISNTYTNISDHIIATTSKTNTFYISNLPPLFSTNGGILPMGSPSSSTIARTMVRTNFVYDPTNANGSWFSNSTVSNLKNGAEVNTRATPGVLLY